MRCTRWGTMLMVVVMACGSAPPAPTAPAVGGSGVEANVDVVVEPALPPLPPLPALSTALVPRPDDVMAVAVVPNVDAILKGAATYANAVRFGLGAKLTVANLAAALGPFAEVALAVDPRQPIRMLALETVTGNLFDSVLIVGSLSANADIDDLDRQMSNVGLRAQRRGNDVVIGTEVGMKAAADYAMTTLLSEPAPNHVTVTVWPQHALEKFYPLVLAIASQAGTPQQVATSTAYLDLLKQVDVVKAELRLDGAYSPSLNVTAIPVAGGSLAAFIAGQHPSDFAILNEVTPGTAMFGGSLNLEPIVASLKAIYPNFAAANFGKMVRMLGEDFGGSGSVDPSARRSYTSSWSVKKPATTAKALLAMVAAVTPPVDAAATVTKVASTYKKSPILTITTTPAVPTDDGAKASAIASGTTEIVSVSYALVDKRLVISSSLPDVKALIDRSLDTERVPAINATVQTAISEAKARGDSALLLIEPGFISGMTANAVQAPGTNLMTVGVGASRNELRLHAYVPMGFFFSFLPATAAP